MLTRRAFLRNGIINEVIDPAPVLEPDNLALIFGQSFDSLGGDTLDSGFSALSGNSLIDNTAFTVEIVNSPSHGKVELNIDGTFTYIHDGSTQLVDEFSYRVTNEDGISTVATVTISIEPPIESAFEANPVIAPAPQVVTKAEPGTEKIEQEESEPSLAGAETEQSLQETPFAFAESTAAEANPADIGDATSIVRDSIVQTNVSPGTQPLDVKHHRNSVSVLSATAEGLKAISSATFGLVFEVKTTSPHDVVSNQGFHDALSQLGFDLENHSEENKLRIRLLENTVVTLSFSACVGALSRALRGGALFTSLWQSPRRYGAAWMQPKSLIHAVVKNVKRIPPTMKRMLKLCSIERRQRFWKKIN